MVPPMLPACVPVLQAVPTCEPVPRHVPAPPASPPAVRGRAPHHKGKCIHIIIIFPLVFHWAIAVYNSTPTFSNHNFLTKTRVTIVLAESAW